MSSIAGVYDKSGKNVLPLLAGMIRETLHRGSRYIGVNLNHSVLRVKRVEELNDCGIEGFRGIGAASRDAEQPFQHEEKRLSLVCDGEIYNKSRIESLTSKQATTDKEYIMLLFEKFLREKPNVSLAVESTINLLDGVFSFALFYEDLFLIARDPIGVKPLYLSEKEGMIAFASERKALWSVGMYDTYPLPPSSWAAVGESGVKINRIKSLDEEYNKRMSLENAEQKLQRFLARSLEKRIKNERIGVLFSGGLDSTVLTKMIMDMGYEPTLYCSGAENSRDVEGAIRTAEKLGLRLKVNYMTLEKIEESLSTIVYIVEETNPVQVSIAVPLFFAAQQARKDGLKFMISGNGADELFGGYARHLQTLESGGYDILHQALLRDIKSMAEDNLQRDDAASMANSIELKLPYLDYKLVRFVLSIPPQYKIAKTNSTYIRKFILRKAAEKIKLPETVINRPKIAMQYGSSSTKLLDTLAKKRGFDKKLSRKYGYKSTLKLYIETIARSKGIPGTNPTLEELTTKIE